MSIHAEDFGVPAEYGHWEGDRAEDTLGPFFFMMEGVHPRTAFRVASKHCNAHDSLHGGVMMAFADYTLCLGANGGSSESVITVSMNSEFIAPAYEGDLVRGECEVLRQGRSMVFVRCVLRTESAVIMSASAVVKRIAAARTDG
jgi:uncharacterized protein (TIGR00369 family)